MNNKAELSQPLCGTEPINLIPTVSFAIAIAAVSSLALAESSPAPVTRTEVKAETRRLAPSDDLPEEGLVNRPQKRTLVKVRFWATAGIYDRQLTGKMVAPMQKRCDFPVRHLRHAPLRLHPDTATGCVAKLQRFRKPWPN